MALARRSLWFAGLAVVMAAVLFVGCSDDNKPTDPKLKETGTIVIDLDFSRFSRHSLGYN